MKNFHPKKIWKHPVLTLIKALESTELKQCEKFIITQFKNDNSQEFILFKYLKVTIKKQPKVNFNPVNIRKHPLNPIFSYRKNASTFAKN